MFVLIVSNWATPAAIYLTSQHYSETQTVHSDTATTKLFLKFEIYCADLQKGECLLIESELTLILQQNIVPTFVSLLNNISPVCQAAKFPRPV